MPKYIVCIYGNFDNRGSVLKNTLSSNEYVIGKKAFIPDILQNAEIGDTLLLCVDQKIIAYGKILQKLSKHPNADENWTHHIVVEKWITLDSFNGKNGISTEGISTRCINGSSPEDIAKEVDPHWLGEKLNEFQTRKISFVEAIARFWKGFFKFNGTATKAEVWYVTLFMFIVSSILGGIATTWVSDLFHRIDNHYQTEIRAEIKKDIEGTKSQIKEVKNKPYSSENAHKQVEFQYKLEVLSELLSELDCWANFGVYVGDFENKYKKRIREAVSEKYNPRFEHWRNDYYGLVNRAGIIAILGGAFIGILTSIPFLALCIRRWRGRALFPSKGLLLLLPCAYVVGVYLSFIPVAVANSVVLESKPVTLIFQYLIMIPVFSTAIFGLILNKNSYKLPISSLQNSGNKSSGFGTPQYQAYSTGFIEALSRFWGNYFNFSGRATRSEFWFAILLNVLANIAFFYFSFVLLAVSKNRFGEASEAAIALIVALQIGWTAITLIPYFSLYTRRLHDTNRSGWLLWLGILVLPAIYLIGVMGFCKSYRGKNKFGDSEKYPEIPQEDFGNESSGFGTPQYQAYSTGFIEALSRFWGNYFNFSGRATRSEFWFAILLNILANIAFFYFSFVLLAVSENRFGEASEAAIALIVALQIGWTAITLIPYFSLYTRRLHDTNRSGWLLWLSILVLPAIYLIGIMGFCKSYQGKNKFGDSEKYSEIPQEEQD